MCGASNLAVVVLPAAGNPQIMTTTDNDYFIALKVEEFEEASIEPVI